jgi:tRNA pseudouridine38-40 synthase
MHLALGVEYDGGAFNGFQLQKHAPSVQGALESAFSQIAALPVRLAPAGRTDTGVHATGQVIGFSTSVERPLKAWVRGANALLPPTVKVTWARAVDADFHARFSAVARRYIYLYAESAYEHEATSPLLRGQALELRRLDDEAMHRAAQALLGEQDFSAVRGAGCQSRSGFRCVHRISVRRVGPLIALDITANAFLLHMVRNIAGVLQQVGEGTRPEAWVGALLDAGDRTRAGRTAPAHGLYLVQVHYPGYDFPPSQLPPLLRVLGGLDRF